MSSSQRTSRGRGGSWPATKGSKAASAGRPPASGATNRHWVPTLTRECATDLQLRQRSYGLTVLQQPEKARLSSFKDSSDTSDRRPVDPPTILQAHPSSFPRDYPDEFLESVSFFTRAHLVEVDPVSKENVKREDVPDEVMHAGGEWWARVKGPKGVGEPIAGEYLVGGEKMADAQARMGVFFIFSKLSIRVPGKYRLLFSLYEITDHVVRKKAACVSDVFEVFSPKLFTGMTASTLLTKHFARQGVKVKIRGSGPPAGSASQPPGTTQDTSTQEAHSQNPSGSTSGRTRKAEDELRSQRNHTKWSGVGSEGVGGSGGQAEGSTGGYSHPISYHQPPLSAYHPTISPPHLNPPPAVPSSFVPNPSSWPVGMALPTALPRQASASTNATPVGYSNRPQHDPAAAHYPLSFSQQQGAWYDYAHTGPTYQPLAQAGPPQANLASATSASGASRWEQDLSTYLPSAINAASLEVHNHAHAHEQTWPRGYQPTYPAAVGPGSLSPSVSFSDPQTSVPRSSTSLPPRDIPRDSRYGTTSPPDAAPSSGPSPSMSRSTPTSSALKFATAGRVAQPRVQEWPAGPQSAPHVMGGRPAQASVDDASAIDSYGFVYRPSSYSHPSTSAWGDRPLGGSEYGQHDPSFLGDYSLDGQTDLLVASDLAAFPPQRQPSLAGQLSAYHSADVQHARNPTHRPPPPPHAPATTANTQEYGYDDQMFAGDVLPVVPSVLRRNTRSGPADS